MLYEYIALITARGGSKGLPRKNVLPLYGIPLIGWTIKAAQGCSYISKVLVSTDDDEIARVSKDFGAEVIDRPDELATDTASSIDVISHAISWLEQKEVQKYKGMILLQPTSPLRTSHHIKDAIELYENTTANIVISVFEPTHTPIKAYLENEDGTLSGLYSNEAPYQRRQDLPKAYQPNGAIYAFSIDEFKLNNHFPRNKVFPYVMSEVESTDIDTLEDLKKVEIQLKLKDANK
ncbi:MULTISPECIES: acylneuraminate cytidylyltransferase family protein [Vibrio]|uniref:acylneuraminate cytidylyltransferase family protein n=1 Tax=Vibrio TaxID=662 RepID=UPI0010C1F337|nr:MULTISPECIES: acylneuraminate cytidylyltransferase family protein [Vibrio]MCS0291039.1 acylneuraminate cytidylyltransferase family protein [Vibrio alginolyticus]MDW1628898.1 acylneuraminate cytidylyltransferase family protein [Vibrio sp. Y176]QCO84783.1 acylneuraminate cytidylyltransferase family protein [Vibrio neocaledonicus]